MAKICYLLQTNCSPAGIYIRLSDGRKIDVRAKTKYSIEPENWSTSKGQPKNLKNVERKKLNLHLEDLSKKLSDYYTDDNGKSVINTEWLKNFLNPPQQEGEIPTRLVNYFQYYALHKKNAIGSSTYKRNQVYQRLIERFEKETKTEYFIKDVNADFKLKFEAYCAKQKYAPNTIARTVKFIKTICYHARNNGIETHFQLNNISVKIKKVDKVFLTLDEIKLIEEKEFEFDYLDNARDWLIISCETGQRVSDLMRLGLKNSLTIRY